MEESKQSYQPIESYQPHLQPKDKGTRRARLKQWLKRHWKVVVPISIVLLLAIGGGAYALLRNDKSPPLVATKKKKPAEPTKYYSPLTGAEVSQADTKRPVTGVMIENSPEARPQSGLKEAGVVFESVTEGGITRFLSLYQEAQPELIGPVRSVRSQFASWVAAFDAGLAHVGGAPEPLAKLRSGQIKDLDQFFNAGAYYRATDRFAPHNVYTTAARLQDLNQSKNYTSSNFTAWARHKKPVTPNAAPTAQVITIPISSPLYNVTYTWDRASNSYPRSQGGAPHLDREKGQISPAAVIVMQLAHDAVSGGNGYTYPNANGSGKAWLFQSGSVVEITWTKPSDKEQLAFSDAAGKTVQLNPGQTWLSAIRPTAAPTWQ